MIMSDYNDSITNVACSVLKYFNQEYKHNTIKDIDEVLEREKPKNVVVILYDGLGYNILNRTLKDKSFFRTNLVRSISSVSPATTTAATTSMLSGLNPCEHGWLGWNLYIPPSDKIVTMFLNKIKDTKEEADEFNVCEKYFPYKTIIEIINDDKRYKGYLVSHFGNGVKYKGLRDMTSKIEKLCKEDGKKYVYAYYEDPDTAMHGFGTDSLITRFIIKRIDRLTKRLASKLEDTVLIVVADHGHLNCEDIILTKDYPDFVETLEGNIWLEGRFTAFKVKDKKNFVKLFNKYFSEHFVLKTKEEVLKEKIFGDGKENKYFRDSLGDYFALSKGKHRFEYKESSHIHKSAHAGFSEDEMRIPLIMVVKK